MNLDIALFGLCKTLLGVLVALFGIFTANRVLDRLLGWGNIDHEVRMGHLPAGILKGAGIVAFGIVIQHVTAATSDAINLTHQGQIQLEILLTFITYFSIHILISLIIGVFILFLGIRVFARLTKVADGMGKVKDGNLSAAIVLGVLMITLAYLAAPGIQILLEGFVPYPELSHPR